MTGLAMTACMLFQNLGAKVFGKVRRGFVTLFVSTYMLTLCISALAAAIHKTLYVTP